MDIFYWILFATFTVGLIGLAGVVTLWMNKKLLNKIIYWLVAFSAGTLIGGAFFHLIAESVEKIEGLHVMILVMVGFILFYILERFLFWHHCHEGKCNIHPMSYLILLGDGLHNIIDGLIIAVAFMVNIKFGWITTLMIISHEVPQELGNFAVLIYSGFDKIKALLYTFGAQLTCVIGGIVGYFISQSVEFSQYLLPFAAGGFIYISASDLIPELHKEADTKKSLQAFVLFLIGVMFMLAIKFMFE